MTDYLGTRHRIWEAIWVHAGEAIEQVLDEVWKDGFQHGREDKIDEELKEGKDVSGMDKGAV